MLGKAGVSKARPKLQSLKNRWLFGFGIMIALLSFMFFNTESKSYTLVCSKSKNIYTVDDIKPRVECIAWKNTRIVASGDYEELQTRSSFLRILYALLTIWPKSKKVIHLSEDFIVVPGLADSHAHVVENGHMSQLPLAGSNSVQEVVERVKAYILSHPDVKDDPTHWIEGMGWDQTKWPGARFPTAKDLDRDPLLRDRLISLSRVDGHARWVSPAVLQLMHDLPETMDGGLIIRDEQGLATGIFVDNAMSLIPVPPWSETQISRFVNITLTQALSYGLTSIHDADAKLDHIKFFKSMAESGKLPIKLYVMGNVQSDDYWGDQIPRLVDYGIHGRLNIRSVKLYADGALGSWGAALLEPYSDNNDTSEFLLNSPEKLRSLVTQFWEDGWQTSVHCIGDRANHVLLDIFEGILDQSQGNISEWRPRIEHAQIFAPHDLERIGKLGVIASVQPTHATSDMGYAQLRLGPKRIKGAYAYQTLLKASPQGILPLGSDFPVEGVNPLLGFYAAVSRLSVDGTSPHGPGGWFPEQRLTREQALKGMTYDAAYASFAEHDIGSLSPGKKADFVVLDKDIMTVPFHEILQVKVKATVVDGEVVYGSL